MVVIDIEVIQVSDMVSTVIIAAIGIGTSLLISWLMVKYGNRGRIKEIQDEMNKVNKDMMEATKNNDKARLAKLEKEADKLPALMKESMLLNFKGMAFSLPLIIIVPWVVIQAFPGFVITLPFNLPVPFRSANIIDWRNTFGPNGWFWITFIFLGGASQLVYSKVKDMKKNKQ